ncbi:glycerophosphodiester phosphodiesterase family protein [Shimia sp.]|uniref:glycerophosphodiester phosphodiesterase family protein n=1 Tax=Shimia sp. TaxID=1954381 RepID=UPI003299EF41
MQRTADQQQILVYGHRGARGIFPENTMAGFQYLYDIGITAVELDVQNAANRLTVLSHDPHVTLTKGADPQLVRKTTSDQLLYLKVGGLRPGSTDLSLFADQAQLVDEHVPTFETFCKWAADHVPMLINAEIKSHAINPDLYDPPEVIISDVVDQLERYRLTDRCVISSFDWRVLSACALRSPDISRGYLTLEQPHGTEMEPNVVDGSQWLDGASREDNGGTLPQMIAALGGKFWCPYFKDLTEHDLAIAQSLGVLVNVWTVNETADIDRMIDMGVDGIISDYPARVLNILKRRNQI